MRRVRNACRMTSPYQPQRWRKLDSRTVASTRIFDVESVDFQHPDHAEPRDFFVINAPDWVNVVALTPQEELVLVRQFRFGTNDLSLETPGGVVDAGEDPLVTGVRELREETGFVGTSARVLAVVHPNPAIQSNRCHIVFIEGAEQSAALAWDPNEEFEILVVPVAEALARAQRGEITHALALNALFYFLPEWEKRCAAREGA